MSSMEDPGRPLVGGIEEALRGGGRPTDSGGRMCSSGPWYGVKGVRVAEFIR